MFIRYRFAFEWDSLYRAAYFGFSSSYYIIKQYNIIATIYNKFYKHKFKIRYIKAKISFVTNIIL